LNKIEVLTDGITSSIEIESNYCRLSTKDFYEFCLSSNGSWVVIEEGVRIITSPGFNGAYYHPQLGLFKELSSVFDLNKSIKSNIQINSNIVIADILSKEFGTNGVNTQSEFLGLEKILSAMVYELNEEEVATCKSLLPKYSDIKSDFSTQLCKANKGLEGELGLMFSGGRDSIAIALGLKKTGSNFSLIYVDQDNIASGGNLTTAIEMAEILDEELIIVDGNRSNYFSSEDSLMKLFFKMETRIINAVAPLNSVNHLGFDHILDGQNMDAMLAMKMPKLRQGSAKTIELLSGLPYLYSYLVRSIVYWHGYEANWFVQLVHYLISLPVFVLKLIDRRFEKFQPDILFPASRDKFLSELIGLPISSSLDFHDLIAKEKYSFDDMGLQSLRQIWWYLYPSRANFFSQNSVSGENLCRTLSYGPMIKFWINEIDYKAVLNYKYPIDAFIQDEMNSKYSLITSSLLKSDEIQIKKHQYANLSRDVWGIIERELHSVEALFEHMKLDEQIVLQQAIKSWVTYIAKTKSLDALAAPIGRDLHSIMRIINYELIARRF
jgi:hypothetical protein